MEKQSLMTPREPGMGSSTGSFLSTTKKKVLYFLAAIVLLVVVTIVIVSVVFLAKSDGDTDECYDTAQKLIHESTSNGDYLWNKLSTMADTYGSRLSGSSNLENAIDWIQQQMIADGLENVHTEDVYVPTWIRGNESLYLISPREKKLGMLGLGGSIGTPAEGITAEVLVVTSFDDLKLVCQNASNKIVLYNVEWEGYSQTVVYRADGAAEAAKCGAIASLLRSITPYSLYTPHTGSMYYQENVTQIPSAAITIEDSEMLNRMQDRGEQIIVTLFMEGHYLNDSLSRNVMGEITGTDPNAGVVVIGGHTDSWDVGQGAMDDGGGVFVAWEAVRLMIKLGMKPKRTIRVVGWTNEENGARGAIAYRNAHINETTVFAMESDNGVSSEIIDLSLRFWPTGFSFSGSDAAYDVVVQIADLLSGIGASTVTRPGGGVDVAPLGEDGVPIAGLSVDREYYFWYHHTEADTMDKIDVDDMNDCVAAMAVMSYCVADRSAALPTD